MQTKWLRAGVFRTLVFTVSALLPAFEKKSMACRPAADLLPSYYTAKARARRALSSNRLPAGNIDMAVDDRRYHEPGGRGRISLVAPNHG